MKHRLIFLLGLALMIALALTLSTTATAEVVLITPEAAQQAALTHAGIAEADATILRVKLDRDGVRMEYEVEFYAGNQEYDYDIDAQTGAVLRFDSEYETPPLPMQDATGLITEEAARAAAFAHATVDASAATLVLAQLEHDNGLWVYNVEFYVGNTEYDYEIDAKTGAVLGFDQDAEHDFRPVVADGDIGEERAKEIALAQTGLQADQVRKLEAERDRKNGATVYEIEFEQGGNEYSYDIDAATGNILKQKVEKDD